MTYDSVAVLHNFAERKEIHYPMLSDPESKIIRAFDIQNEAIPRNTMAYGVPNPGTYITDANGIVQAKYFEDDYRDRYTAANILWRQFGAGSGPAQATAETSHVRLTLGSTDAVVWAGTRVTLVLDIELKPRMHVYAPGVEGGYIAIDWKMAESKGWRVHDAAYPQARKLHLKAINETLPVYENRFRLTRDITVGQNAAIKPLIGADGNITVEGFLRYQACDDKVCFTPQTVPLKWTFHVKPLDSQRVPAELQRK